MTSVIPLLWLGVFIVATAIQVIYRVSREEDVNTLFWTAVAVVYTAIALPCICWHSKSPLTPQMVVWTEAILTLIARGLFCIRIDLEYSYEYQS